MSGTNGAPMPHKSSTPEIITLTVAIALKLLEHNTFNRPLSDRHVQRLARQIIEGKWKFNGDTVKVAKGGDVLDGQHRLWAVIEAKKSIKTIIVYEIARDAFSTIDTIRRMRSGGDVLALSGVTRYRVIIATALTWMLRWQRGVLEDFKAPQNRIENSDIEEAFSGHPGMVRAAERATKLRRITNPSIMAFLYYVITNRDADLAERMMDTLENPARRGVDDPFFRLRAYFTADHLKRKEPLISIALTIKAANAAHRNKDIQALSWRAQGKSPEAFPTLNF